MGSSITLPVPEEPVSLSRYLDLFFYVIGVASKNNGNKRMPSFVALARLFQFLCVILILFHQYYFTHFYWKVISCGGSMHRPGQWSFVRNQLLGINIQIVSKRK